jgi:hypothetical protein
MTPEELAEVVARVLAPLVTRVKALEQTREAAFVETAALRERLAVVEVKPLIPGPPGHDGTNGADGMQGRDGFDLKAFNVCLEADRRTLLFTFGDGDHAKEARVKVPWLLDQGVYHETKAYERGDMVSWDGAGWVAREDTATRPGASGLAWRMFFKRWDGKR